VNQTKLLLLLLFIS